MRVFKTNSENCPRVKVGETFEFHIGETTEGWHRAPELESFVKNCKSLYSLNSGKYRDEGFIFTLKMDRPGMHSLIMKEYKGDCFMFWSQYPIFVERA